MATPALANRGYQHNTNDLGYELLEDIVHISQQRLNDLDCFGSYSNDDFCISERSRLQKAKRNLSRYNGNLGYVKRVILADINDRKSYRHRLQCGLSSYSRTEICRYENLVIIELSNIFLIEINQAIFHLGINYNYNTRHRYKRIHKRKHHKRIHRGHHRNRINRGHHRNRVNRGHNGNRVNRGHHRNRVNRGHNGNRVNRGNNRNRVNRGNNRNRVNRGNNRNRVNRGNRGGRNNRGSGHGNGRRPGRR